MDKQKKLIAIVQIDEVYSDYSGNYECIIKSITEWSEVTREEFDLLKRRSLNYNWRVIERLDLNDKFIPTTIQAALAEAKAAEEEEVKRKEELAKRKLERELKKKAKTEEQEKALLKELAQKYGKV